MFKITAIVSLMFIVSSVWSACDSCGSECASACGTRRFRACCFNYLRKKRGPEMFKIQSLAKDVKESQSRAKMPIFVVESSVPEQWIPNEYYPYSPADTVENHLY